MTIHNSISITAQIENAIQADVKYGLMSRVAQAQVALWGLARMAATARINMPKSMMQPVGWSPQP